MFHVAYPRGQGPAFADLPPTLQPHAIAASAPPVDRLRTAALSGLIYLLLGGATLAFTSLTPAVTVAPIPPTRPDRIVEFEGPPLPRLIERMLTAPGGSGSSVPASPSSTVTTASTAAAVRADPDEPAPGLPTGERQAEPGPGHLNQGGPLVPPGTPLSGSGTPAIHDFSLVGLTVLRQVDPIYPDFARRAHIQGAVVLKMTVNEEGQPIQVQVLEGHTVFHEVALQAARQWRFEPARLEGRPVPASFRLTLKFSLR